MARSALPAYLTRTAREVTTAWNSCMVIARLYPEQARQVGEFLLGFCRQRRQQRESGLECREPKPQARVILTAGP